MLAAFGSLQGQECPRSLDDCIIGSTDLISKVVIAKKVAGRMEFGTISYNCRAGCSLEGKPRDDQKQNGLRDL